MGGTRGSGIVSSAADMLWMGVVQCWICVLVVVGRGLDQGLEGWGAVISV